MTLRIVRCPNCKTDISFKISWGEEDENYTEETVFLRAHNAYINGLEDKTKWQCPVCFHIWDKTPGDEVNLNENELKEE